MRIYSIAPMAAFVLAGGLFLSALNMLGMPGILATTITLVAMAFAGFHLGGAKRPPDRWRRRVVRARLDPLPRYGCARVCPGFEFGASGHPGIGSGWQLSVGL